MSKRGRARMSARQLIAFDTGALATQLASRLFSEQQIEFADQPCREKPEGKCDNHRAGEQNDAVHAVIPNETEVVTHSSVASDDGLRRRGQDGTVHACP